MQTTETRYINALTDFGFKKIFGDKEILTAFLTDLLKPQSPIKEITFLDKERSGLSEYERSVIYDILCTAEDGSEFIVEMQNRNQQYFGDRIVYYLSRSFSSQEERGNPSWNFKLRPVYGIFFLNFHLRDFKPQNVRTVQLKVEETGEVFSDKLKFFTLELPSYRNMSESDCKTKIDYWLYNITNLETMKSSVPFQSQQPVFGRVGNIAELVRMTPQELKQYNISIDTYRSNLAVMKNERREGYEEGRAEGRAEGREEGRAEGREEGRAEGALLIARNLKQMGLSTSDVMKATGLTAAELSGI